MTPREEGRAKAAARRQQAKTNAATVRAQYSPRSSFEGTCSSPVTPTSPLAKFSATLRFVAGPHSRGTEGHLQERARRMVRTHKGSEARCLLTAKPKTSRMDSASPQSSSLEVPGLSSVSPAVQFPRANSPKTSPGRSPEPLCNQSLTRALHLPRAKSPLVGTPPRSPSPRTSVLSPHLAANVVRSSFSFENGPAVQESDMKRLGDNNAAQLLSHSQRTFSPGSGSSSPQDTLSPSLGVSPQCRSPTFDLDAEVLCSTLDMFPADARLLVDELRTRMHSNKRTAPHAQLCMHGSTRSNTHTGTRGRQTCTAEHEQQTRILLKDLTAQLQDSFHF